MVRSNSAAAVADYSVAAAPHRPIKQDSPTSRREPADWPLDDDDDSDGNDESEPDLDDFDELPLDDFELDDEPDPEPGDFWGDVDDEEF